MTEDQDRIIANTIRKAQEIVDLAKATHRSAIPTNLLRGHGIEQINGVFVYSDTKEPTAENYKARPCGHCGRHNTPEGHDACIGALDNVKNACCGHGVVEEAYVQFNIRAWEMIRINGQEALDYIEKHKPCT